MATIRVEVPTSEQVSGYITYEDVAGSREDASGTLLIIRGDHILAEYPAGRFLSWELLDKGPYTEPVSEE